MDSPCGKVFNFAAQFNSNMFKYISFYLSKAVTKGSVAPDHSLFVCFFGCVHQKHSPPLTLTFSLTRFFSTSGDALERTNNLHTRGLGWGKVKGNLTVEEVEDARCVHEEFRQ